MSNDKNTPPQAHFSPKDSFRAIIKSTSVMSLGTLVSRILGFVRDVVLARFFGTAALADAFFVAFRIPNLFRDLVGEGAVNSSLVPVVADYVEKEDRQKLREFLSAVFIVATVLLVIITILGVVFAPWIVRIIAPGFIGNPEKLQITVELTRLMFPYLFLIGLTAYCMGILFTLRAFFTPAFGPCFLNVCLIGAALLSARYLPQPIYGLAYGVLVGGVLQLLFQIPSLLRRGIFLTWPGKIFNDGVKRVGKLLVPRMMGSAVYQSTVFVDTFCASLSSIVGVGGISAIYYANRIILFPLGVFGIAMASAVLPRLSGMASRGDEEGIRKTITFSLENIFFILSPCAIFLITLAEPIIRMLFERGAFNQYSTSITSWALLCYSFGLVSYGGIKILSTSFHALQDTKTPVKAAAVCLVLNAGLNFILMHPFKIGGIALASSIAATVDFIILFWVMHKRINGIALNFSKFLVKLLFACLIMAVAINHLWNTALHWSELPRLIITGIVGVLVFFAACSMMQLQQAKKIKAWVGGLLK